MNEYLLIVYGNSSCDYSLGCGINVIDLRTSDYNEARKKAMNIIYENLAGQEYAKYHEYKLDEDGFSRWELIHTDWDNSRCIQSAQIVLHETDIDINEIKNGLMKELDKGLEEKKRQEEYEQFLKLREKYDNR